MNSSDRDFRVEALLSVLFALRGYVTPDLRAVMARIEDPVIGIRFVYESSLNHTIRDVVSDIETLVLADMPERIDVQVSIESLDSSIPIIPQVAEDLVFMRREDDDE